MTTDTQDRVLQHRIGPDGLLVLHLHDGEARIRGTSGDTATVRSIDGEALAGLEVETGDRSLSIRAGRGPDSRGLGRRSRPSTELEVDVPSGATVVIEAASADIEARGLHGDQRYRSASGDLVLADVSGSVTADSVSGDLEIVASGPATLSARTVSGDLSLSAGSVTELQAATTSGDLQIEGLFDGPGPYAIETVSGDLVLAPANDVRVEVSTITGDLRSDVAARRDDDGSRRAFVMGKGGPTIGFRSTSGDLLLARSTPSAAEAVATIDGPTPLTPSTPPTPPTPPSPPSPTTPPAPTPEADPTIAPISGTAALDEAIEDARLAVLRDLERGKIDVAEAGRRLETLESPDEPVGQEDPRG